MTRFLYSEKLKKISLIFLAAIHISACTQRPAIIEHRQDKYYGWSEFFGQNREMSPITTVVKKGDTIESIAKKNQVLKSDIIALNSLIKGEPLIVGSQLMLPGYKIYYPKRSDKLSTIATKYGINLEDLAEINGLKPPYNLKTVDLIRVPGSVNSSYNPANTQIASNEIDVSESRKPGQKLVKVEPVILTDIPREKTKSIKASLQWPVAGNLITKFSPSKASTRNDGINITTKLHTPVKAARNGKVVYSGNELQGYGNIVIIKHDDGLKTAYAYLEDAVVHKNDIVNTGQTIGHVGYAQHSKVPQLYFSVRDGKDTVDPMLYLSSIK